jgi:hypothetical protein
MLFTVGVTVMVAIIALAPVFAAVNDGIFPVPLAPKPIAVFEFVQVNEPPTGELAKAVATKISPFVFVMFAGTVTVGTTIIGVIGVGSTIAV